MEKDSFPNLVTREKLLKEALAHCIRVYNENESIWNILTTKAQALVAGSGAFFVALMGINIGIEEYHFDLLIQVIAVWAFFVAAFFGLLALLVQESPALESGETLQIEVEDILTQGRVHFLHYENFLRSRIKNLVVLNDDLDDANGRKSTPLYFGQIFFSLGIVLLFILLVIRLL